MILLFNFVIAILSSTFAFFEKTKLGLYYNVLNSLFAEMEWDDHYGALICVKPPLPTSILLIPLLPFYMLLTDKSLRNFNTFVCFLLFIPNSVMHLVVFVLINTVSIPFVYVSLTFSLLRRIFTSHSASNFFKSIAALLVYLVTAPCIYAVSLPIDAVTFLLNMYLSDMLFEERDIKGKALITVDTLLEFNKFLKKLRVEVKSNKMLNVKRVPVVYINKLAQKSLRVIDEIRAIIYSTG